MAPKALQEQGYEGRGELALAEEESQTARERLERLLRHSDEITWDDVESNIQHLMVSESTAMRPFPWHKILPKLKTRQKKSKKRVHGRMTYTVAQPHSRVTTPQRSVTSCPGRRHSRPVGSCWAGKGACLQDFSKSPETRGRGNR
ncbi:hypothetical protein HOLleu_36654 [Holothuria leucospilota]|uniref:Uncharacterized protein n=1 Tax=Holothuria leucospilota TaxID=206669 RepID=A0A9Q0YPJ5_HOLLE|nr:hypothetical protein HOLleu_36654 [Holothuria leucospilota]